MEAQQVRVSEPREFMLGPKGEVWGAERQGKAGWGTVRLSGQNCRPPQKAGGLPWTCLQEARLVHSCISP